MIVTVTVAAPLAIADNVGEAVGSREASIRHVDNLAIIHRRRAVTGRPINRNSQGIPIWVASRVNRMNKRISVRGTASSRRRGDWVK